MRPLVLRSESTKSTVSMSTNAIMNDYWFSFCLRRRANIFLCHNFGSDNNLQKIEINVELIEQFHFIISFMTVLWLRSDCRNGAKYVSCRRNEMAKHFPFPLSSLEHGSSRNISRTGSKKSLTGLQLTIHNCFSSSLELCFLFAYFD